MRGCLLLASLAVLIPAGALAQVPAVAPPYHPAIDNPQVRSAFERTNALRDTAFAVDRFNEQFNSAYLARQIAWWRESHNPRRIRRAEAAATLINSGDCDGALALARKDRDGRLAERINQVCIAISVSDPAAAASGS